MSKTTKPQEDAQAPVTTQTEPQNAKIDPTDEAFFFTNFRAADEDFGSYSSLRWKKDANPAQWHCFYIRPDQMQNQRGDLRRASCVQVTRDGEILGIPMTDLFEDEQFDDDGTVGDGVRTDPETRKITKELFLWIQPIGAYNAQLRLIGEQSDQYLNPDRGKHERGANALIGAAASAGARSGMVTVRTAEVGVDDSPTSGWGGLR